MKDKAIVRMKLAAERDLAISDGAFRLLMRIGSHVYVDPKKSIEKPFPLAWSTVALWCGVNDQKTAYRRLTELVRQGYLKCDGLRGCPPINWFFLVPNSPKKGGIDSPQNGGNVTPKKGGNDSGVKGGHHISNSLQEEKIKGKREENVGSLRSGSTVGTGLGLPLTANRETVGAALAATPEGERQRQLLSQLRQSLVGTNGGRHRSNSHGVQRGTKTALEEKQNEN